MVVASSDNARTVAARCGGVSIDDVTAAGVGSDLTYLDEGGLSCRHTPTQSRKCARNTHTGARMAGVQTKHLSFRRGGDPRD